MGLSRHSRGFPLCQQRLDPCDPYVGFLEVKACKHPYRLAKDKISQLAKLNLFEMAGAKSYVLVNHYLQGYWRVPTNWLADGVPSWDLSNCATYPPTSMRSTPTRSGGLSRQWDSWHDDTLRMQEVWEAVDVIRGRKVAPHYLSR